MKKRSGNDGDKKTWRNEEDEVGAVTESGNPTSADSKALLLILHQSNSVFHTGGTPNFV